jgi:hypothetical protein
MRPKSRSLPRGQSSCLPFRNELEAFAFLLRYGPGLFPGKSKARFMCLMFVAERTLSYRKTRDACSFSQFSKGIRSQSGAWVRGSSGISKATCMAAIRQLEAAGLVTTERTSSASSASPTVYAINWHCLLWAAKEKYGRLEKRWEDLLAPSVETSNHPGSIYASELVRESDIHRQTAHKRKEQLQSEQQQMALHVTMPAA